MIDFPVSFTSKEITPWGGMAFLKQMLDKMQFSQVVSHCEHLPVSGSNRGYAPEVILESFFTSIWCGANRFMHTELTRLDPALARIFGWKNVPAQDVFKRYFSKFNQVTNLAVSQHFYSWIFDNFHFDHFTLDIDSSILTRYGNDVEGAKKGYNPKKKGRNSHHPLIAFVSDVNLVANMWLRSGDTSSANNFLSFLEDTLQKLQHKTVGLIRLDSGFFQSDILDHLEARNTDYIIAAKFTHPIQCLIADHKAWIRLDDGIEICEQYVSNRLSTSFFKSSVVIP
ncbi:MAG: transposase [Saprospiraceae bacterium]|nr:transposase [Saprospiraceae bacterium]